VKKIRLDVLVAVLLLLCVASLFTGSYFLKQRSKLKEVMDSIAKKSEKDRKNSFNEAGRVVVYIAQKLGWTDDFGPLERKLFLAGRPFNFTAQEFIGAWIVLVAVVLVICVLLVFSGTIPSGLGLIILFFFSVLPYLLVDSGVESGRAKLSTEVIDLVSMLELGVSAGLSETRVLEWAAESDGMLAVILKTAIKEVEMGKLSYVIFNRLADEYDIPEARNVAVSLKQAGVQGLSIGQALIELSRDLRDAREREAEIRVVKLKPTIDSILTVSVMVAAIMLMIGPMVAENFSMLDQMFTGGF